jgi:hypothetical protein
MGGRKIRTAASAVSAGPGGPRVSEFGLPGMSPRLAAGRRPWWIWAAPFALVLTVLVVRSRFLFTDRYYEDVDAAANSILIQQAMHFTLLVGNYSREGFNHPGPAYMYVQAAGQWLFQYALRIVPTAWNAHVLAGFALNSAWVSMITGVVYGWTRSLRGAAICLAVVLGCVATEPWILSYDWMPWLYVPAYIAFLVAAASVAAGASRDLWILTLAGWFLIHGHACFLFFVPVILAAALAVVVWRHGPRAVLQAFLRARVWVPVAVISAVFALPIVADLMLHWPGDFGKYFSYASSSTAGGHDLVQVVRYTLWFWWRDDGTRAVALVPVVLYAVAIAAAGWLARGAVRRFLVALLAVNVGSTAAFACYAAAGIDHLQEYYIGFFYFSAPIITLLVISVAVVHAPPVPLGAVLAAGAAVLGVAAFALAPATAVNTSQTDPALPGAVRAVAAQAGGKTVVIRFNHDAWADVAGFLVQAERTGVRACVQNPGWTFMMTRQFICTPGQVAGGTPFWFDSPAAPRGTAVIATLKNSQVIAGLKPLSPAGPGRQGGLIVTDPVDFQAIREHCVLPERGRIVTSNAASTQPPRKLLALSGPSGRGMRTSAGASPLPRSR